MIRYAVIFGTAFLLAGCGGVGAGVPARIAVTPSTIRSGESATLTWSLPGNAQVVSSDFGVTGGGSGSLVVTPSATRSYSLRGAGTSPNGAPLLYSATCRIIVQ